MSDAPAEFARLLDIIASLRAPDGCPWDRKQTPQTMRKHLLEETYEAIEAIDSSNPPHVSEELGDVTMLVALIARMYEESDDFGMCDVLQGVNEKLIRRHPHVFGESTVQDEHEVVAQWQTIKTDIEGKAGADGHLDSVSKGLPSLERAQKLQKRAAKVGFDWPALGGVLEKIEEELGEVRDQLHSDGGHEYERLSRFSGDTATGELEAEIGDLLFSVVNLARYLGIDASLALQKTNTEFVRRFRMIEERITGAGGTLEEAPLEELDRLWNEAKVSG